MVGVVWGDVPCIPVLTFVFKGLQLVAWLAEGFSLCAFLNQTSDVTCVGIYAGF